MPADNEFLSLPYYHDFVHSLSFLALPISASMLHGMICGYLCAGAEAQGESYLRALINNKKDVQSRQAILALFEVFSISQQQMEQFDFQFQMLLPNEHNSMLERAQAFAEWCDGFTQALKLAGVDIDGLEEEEMQDALQHITEFADLDVDSLDVSEEDERALMEVSEYTRMAVVRLHHDLKLSHPSVHESEQRH